MCERVRCGNWVGDAYPYNHVGGGHRADADAAVDSDVDAGFRRCRGNRLRGNDDTANGTAADAAGAGAGPAEGARLQPVADARAGEIPSSAGERPAADTCPGPVSDAGGPRCRQNCGTYGVRRCINCYTNQAYSQYVICTVIITVFFRGTDTESSRSRHHYCCCSSSSIDINSNQSCSRTAG